MYSTHTKIILDISYHIPEVMGELIRRRIYNTADWHDEDVVEMLIDGCNELGIRCRWSTMKEYLKNDRSREV